MKLAEAKEARWRANTANAARAVIKAPMITCRERMTLRRQFREMLATPRSASSLARELGLRRGDVEDDLRHAIKSARAAGERVVVTPAKCKQCGFVFGEEKLSKPGKCPECRGTRIFEPLVGIER